MTSGTRTTEAPRLWRPSLPRYLSFARAGMIVVAVAALVETVLLVFLRTAALAALPVAVVIVLPGSIAFGSQVVRIWRTTVSVDEDWVHWRGVFTTARLRRSAVRGVLAPVKQPMMAPTTMLLLSDGSQRVRLVAGLWAEADLTSVADTLGLDTAVESLTQSEIETHVPGATTKLGRHPWRTAVGIAALIVVVTTVVSTILVLSDQPPTKPPRGPSRVAQQTVVGQTRELAQLQSAFTATGWSEPHPDLWTCDDDDGNHGWQRHIQSTTSKPGNGPDRAVSRVESVLRGYGYTVSSPERDGQSITVDGERDTPNDGATAELIINPQAVSIDLTGACEV